MSDENSNLANALKEKLEKIEGENAQLREQNTQMKEQIDKLMDKIGGWKWKNSK